MRADDEARWRVSDAYDAVDDHTPRFIGGGATRMALRAYAPYLL